MNVLSQTCLLHDFLTNHQLNNFITEPTRVRTKFMTNSNSEKNSSTLIDVLVHNKNLVTDTRVIDCPFSDHKFIVGAINIEKPKVSPQTFWSRNLSEKNLLKLESRLNNINFQEIDKFNCADSKWEFLKKEIVSKMDEVCPLKKVTSKPENKFPWFDLELYKVKRARDTSYAAEIKSKLSSD